MKIILYVSNRNLPGQNIPHHQEPEPETWGEERGIPKYRDTSVKVKEREREGMKEWMDERTETRVKRYSRHERKPRFQMAVAADTSSS